MTDIPQAALRARQMYLDRIPVRVILAETGFSHDRLYFWLDGGPQSDGSRLLAPLPRRHIVVRKSSRAATRVALVTRLMRATEMQVHEIEQRLGTETAEPTSRERDARMLAIMAKTMRDLIALDTQNSADTGEGKPAQTDDEFIPQDVDELRRELARRVDQLRQRRAAGGTAGDV
jgi:hypothetical protein